MSGILQRLLILLLVAGAAGGGYLFALQDRGRSEMAGTVGNTGPASKEPSGPIIYYRDPDGGAAYSATPRHTEDGRAFRAVRASEDVTFDPKPEMTASADRRVLYYRNPMGLPDISSVPKKDSMGMDYLPVYEGDETTDSSVKVSPGKLQRTGVRTEPVARRALERLVRAPGAVELDERRISLVTTRSDSFVDRVADVTTGDRVVKGQPLLNLYSPEIASAGAQLLTELATTTRSGLLGGARVRLENLGVPPEAITEMEQTRKVPLSITWRAPRDGLVLERNAVNGMKASAGEVLFRLADISSVWIIADIPEAEMGAVKIGAQTTIRIRSIPGTVFEGRITVVYPQIMEATRTARVRVEVANPAEILRPKMFVDVEIKSGGTTPVLTVPSSAVVETGSAQLVIVERSEGRYEPRAVKIGERGNGFVEVIEGLAERDKVVTAANFLIDAESNLKAALRGLTVPEVQP